LQHLVDILNRICLTCIVAHLYVGYMITLLALLHGELHMLYILLIAVGICIVIWYRCSTACTRHWIW